MTLLAVAVDGRGSSIRTSRCSAPTTRRSCAAAPRSRRSRVYGGHAVPARAEHLDRLAASAAAHRPAARRSGRVRRARGQALAAAGAPDAVLRLFWTAARASRARARRRRCRRPLEEQRARGMRRVSLRRHPRGRAVAPPRREVDELRRQHGGRGRGEAAWRRRCASSSTRTDSCSKDRRRTSGGGAGETLFTPVARPRHPRRRHAGDGDRARAERRHGSRRALPLDELARADEAFTSSSVRELMPVAGVDGSRSAPRHRPADERSGRARVGAAEATLARRAMTRRSGSAAWRSRTACSCTARRAWACAVRPPDGALKVAAARKRSSRGGVTDAVPARPAAARGGVRAPAGAQAARCPRRELPFERPARARGDARQRGRRPGRPRRRRGSAPARAGARRRAALARARAARAPRRRARRLPRRRAHLDRHATSTASRARRSTSAAARTSSGRCSSRPPSATRSPRTAPGAPARRGARRRLARRGRRLDRGLRLDGAAPRPPARAGARAARPRAPAPARDRRADARAARGRRGGARAPASSSSDGDDASTRARRLPPEIFDLPVEKMREGYYTDAYFNHARATLLADGRRPRVVMQVFQKQRRVCSAAWTRRSPSSSSAPTTGTR